MNTATKQDRLMRREINMERSYGVKAVLAIGLSLFLSVCGGCKPTNEFVAPPPPSVTVANPEQKDITVYQTFPGRLTASAKVNIRARVKGYLKVIHFEDGQLVNKGDLLFTIEPDEYEIAVRSAEAKQEQAEAHETLSETKSKRTKKAFKSDAVSELDMLITEAEYKSAISATKVTRAALEAARLNLSYTEIRAPMAGRMSRKTLDAGNLVGDGNSTLLATLLVRQPIDTEFHIDEGTLLPYLAKRKKDSSNKAAIPYVQLELADGRIHSEKGTITYADSEFNPGTGTLLMQASFPNEDITLYPGLFVKVMVPFEMKQAVLIPESAILRGPTGTYVLTVNDEMKVVPRPVDIGTRMDQQRIITQGLGVEDRVITKGFQRARPGIAVQLSTGKTED